MSKNVFAYTAPGALYPEYVSINETDGKLQLTVRSPFKPAGAGPIPWDRPGDVACATVPWEFLPGLIERLQKLADEKRAELS